MEQVRFLREAIMTGEVAEIEIEDWSYDETLNRPGSLSGKVDKFSPLFGGVYDTDDVSYRTAVYAVRGTNVEWGGLLLPPPALQTGAEMVDINCIGWLGYWDRRRIRTDYTPTTTEQFTIFRHLVLDAQDSDLVGVEADLGIDVVWDAVSGVTRDRSYLATDSKTLGDALRELAAVIDGFDFAMEYSLNATTDRIDKQIKLFYPTKGRDTGFLFEYERGKKTNVVGRGFSDPVEFAWTGDGWGSGNGDTRLRSSYVDPTLSGIYPPYDAAPSFQNVTIQSTLDDHTEAAFERTRRPRRTPVIAVDPEAFPRWGDYVIGDSAGLRIDDGYGSTAPNGVPEPWRITGSKVTAGETFAIVLGESEAEAVGAGATIYVPSGDAESDHVTGTPETSQLYRNIDGGFDPNSAIYSDGDVGEIPVYLANFNVGADDFEGNRISSVTLSIFSALKTAAAILTPTVSIGGVHFDGSSSIPGPSPEWNVYRLTTDPSTSAPWTVTAVRKFANDNSAGWFTTAQTVGFDTAIYRMTLTVVFE